MWGAAAINLLCALVQPSAQPPETWPIRGRVLDARGQPIAAAAIGLVGSTWHDAQVAAAPHTRTDAGGWFTVACPYPQTRAHTVVVVAEARATMLLDLPHSVANEWYGVDPPADFGDIVLRDAVTVRGKVRTVRGVPLEGATVTWGEVASAAYTRTGRGISQPISVACSDAKGNFTLLAPSDVASVVTVRAPGHFRERRRYATTSDPLLFELRPSREIRGRFLDADGRPAPGEVALTNGRDWVGTWEIAPDGSFAVTVEAEGAVTLQAVEHRCDARTVAVPFAALGAEVELRLPAVAPVEVAVVDVATRQPIAGASVRVIWVDSNLIEHILPPNSLTRRPVTVTGADGRARLPGPSGSNRLGMAMVSANGYAPAMVRGVDVASDKVPTFELHRGTTVTGRVQDDDGKPIAGARVRALANDEMLFLVRGGSFACTDTLTRDDGSFTLPPLQVGRWKFEASAPGHADKSIVCTLVDNESPAAELALAKTSTLRGRLVGGAIGAGWRIRDVPRDAAAMWSPLGAPSQRGLANAVPVAADGSFVLTDVSGRRQLVLSIPDVHYFGGGFDLDLGRVTVSGDHEHEVNVTKRLAGAIRGQVRMSGAKLRHPRLRVELHGEPGYRLLAVQTVGRDGRFALATPPGEYMVSLVEVEHGLVLADRQVKVAAETPAEVPVDLVLVPLELELTGPSERLRTVFLELRGQLEADAAGPQDPRFWVNFGRRLALDDGRTNFDLLVPQHEFTASLHEGRWSTKEPLAEASARPKAGQTTKLKLALGE